MNVRTALFAALLAAAPLYVLGQNAPTYSLTDLGTLGGTYSEARGVNAAGQSTGDAYITGNGAPHAFLYASGAMQDVGTLGGSASYGTAINAGGAIAGYSFMPGGQTVQAFLYANVTRERPTPIR